MLLLLMPLVSAVTIPLILNVEDVFRITDAHLSSLKITPTAGVGANLTLTIRTSSSATVEALFLGQVIELNGSDLFETALHLPYDLAPGNYSIAISARAGSETATQQLSFVYNPLAAVLLDLPKLDTKKLVPGDTLFVEGDEDLKTTKPTLYNAGNVPVTLAISAETPYDGEEKIALANVQFAIGDDEFGPLKTATQEKSISLQPGETIPFHLKITVPMASGAGTYVGAVKITAR